MVTPSAAMIVERGDVTDSRAPRRRPVSDKHLYARMVDVEPIFETGLGKLYNADCLDVLPRIGEKSVDLLFADPPFNLGKDYGNGVSDSLKDGEYLRWCEQWITEGVRVLKPGGAFFLWNLPRWNIELGHRLNEAGMMFRHWVAVDIKSSLPIPGRLYPSHYSLLYYTKGKPKFFERPRVPIPVCRHCGGDIKDYGGHRNKLHPDGLNLTDVWTDVPPVRHRKTKRRGANELSIKLLRRVLEIASEPGDLVFRSLRRRRQHLRGCGRDAPSLAGYRTGGLRSHNPQAPRRGIHVRIARGLGDAAKGFGSRRGPEEKLFS